MTLDPRPRFADGSDRVERLSVATPVYSDESGACFGMVLIEADISRRVEEVLLGLDGVECEVFVADGEGKLWVSADPENGVRIAAPGQVIDDLPPELVQPMGEQAKPFEIEKDHEFIGKRFYVDPSGRGVFIFARLLESHRGNAAPTWDAFSNFLRLRRRVLSLQ